MIEIEGLQQLNIIKGTCQHLKLLSCGEQKAFNIIERELKSFKVWVTILLNDEELKKDILSLVNSEDFESEAGGFLSDSRAAGISKDELILALRVIKEIADKAEAK